MRTKTKIMTSLAALLCAACFTTTASAEDVSLRLSAGASEQMDVNNAGNLFLHNPYEMGQTGDARLLFKVVPNLSLGAQATGYYFQESPDVDKAGVLWHFGPTVSLHGSKEKANWSPYVDVSPGLASDAHQYFPSLQVQAGVDLAFEPSHSYWVGPFVSYEHAFDTESGAQPPLFNHNDFNAISAGISLTFDLPVHQQVVYNTTVRTEVVQAPATPVAPCPPPATVPATKSAPRLIEVVLFAKNSSKLTSGATWTLDQVVSEMNADTTYNVVVQGSASSEGGKSLNLHLSKARGDVVSDYLVAHGVASSRLQVSGMGGVGMANDPANRATRFIVIVIK
jgi:outer membrane protein OmpA-like peptidoglycan-associated protein